MSDTPIPIVVRCVHCPANMIDIKLAASQARVLEQDATIAELRGRLEVVENGLHESVVLQSHYAALLNQYDGGNRKGFADKGEWLARLAAIASQPERKHVERSGKERRVDHHLFSIGRDDRRTTTTDRRKQP